jgi:hypothetical protein
MSPAQVFFFRGLSTYGLDHAKWSVFDFGPIHGHFASELSRHGIEFHPVLGMGAGPLPEVARRAREYIERHPAWRDPSRPVHFLGHSAGGLIARLVLPELEAARPGKILSCLTIATPHAGSQLAQIAVEMPERYRGSTLILRSFGYNVRIKRRFFEELTKDGIARVLGAGRPSAAEAASIVAAAPRREWCPPLRLFYKVKAFNDFALPSDGIVERDSQPFGNVIGELPIDHFRQVGLFGERHRFESMCGLAARFFEQQQKRA